MRRVNESPAILQEIATVTGLPSTRVAQVVGALRDVVDETFLDGYSIFVPPFVLAYPNDPVAVLFDQRFDTADPADIDAWFVGDFEATSRWLGITEDDYLRHPVASALALTIRLLDALDIGSDSPEHDDVLAIAEAWFDTFETPRYYRFSRVGLESDLERWLVHHPERLTDLGYPVRLRHQQLVLPDKRRPDLVFDLTEDGRAIGTLVVELKSVGGYVEAVDQLAGYLTAVSALGRSDGILRGLLVADGFTPEVQDYAAEQGIETLSLSALGYRAALATDALPAGRPNDIASTPITRETIMTKYVAVVKTTSDDREVGRWTFSGGETPEAMRVQGAEGLNEYDQKMLDDGLIKTLHDFLHLVVGGRGTRDYEWEGGDDPFARTAPTINASLAALEARRLPRGNDEGDATTDYYLLDKGRPFLILRADSDGNVCEVIKVDDNDWQFDVAHEELRNLTASQMVRFFGRETGLMPVSEYRAALRLQRFAQSNDGSA